MNNSTTKTNILFFNYEYPPLGGGAANATKYLLREYAKRDDISVTLITSSTDKERVESLSENVSIHYLDIGKQGNIHYQSNKDLLTYSWKAYWYAKNLLKTQQFDLIHAFFGIPCGFIAQRLGLPYIVSLRGSDVPFYNPRFEKLDKLLFQRMSRDIWKNSKATIANSQGLKDLALESAPTQEIGVIYNGIDINEFSSKWDLTEAVIPNSIGDISENQQNHSSTTSVLPARHSELVSESSPLKILAVGRLIPRKGFDLLIQAAQGLDVTITIIGDGPERENLQTMAQDLQVPVTFTGAIDHDEIVQHYQAHDLFVLPSANEGMSNTVLEAMATGLPIITTNTGGTAELITDNGWVIDRTDQALKTALTEAIETRETLITKGKSSRSKAETMSWTAVADSYIQEYQK